MDRTGVGLLVLANVLAGAGGLLAGLAPVALKSTVDAATEGTIKHGRTASIAIYASAYVLCLCAGRVIGELRSGCTGAAEQRLLAALRLRFFRHVLQLPLKFHLEQRSGSLVHALQQATTGCQIALLSFVNGIVPVLVEGATVAGVLFSLHQPGLTVTLAATAVAYFALISARVKGLGNAAKNVSEASSDANSILADSLTNFEPIKSFGVEEQASTQYAQALERLQDRWGLLRSHRMGTGLATTAIFAVAMSVTLAIAVAGIGDGTLSIGSFVLINVYLAQMVRPLEILATSMRDLSQGLGFMAPFMEVVQEPVEAPPKASAHSRRETAQPGRRSLDQAKPQSQDSLAPGANGPPGRSMSPHLELRDVRLCYLENKPVLDELSLDIPAGKTLAIVGASGCGKSSIVRMLLRLYTPQAGSILLNGMPLDELPLGTLRSMIAVVPQDTVLFNTSIAANIALGKNDVTAAEISEAARLAGLKDFIDALPLGYETPIGERGLKLSGGERQRLAIARAILRKPLVYVFDEATSMLDGQTEAAVLESLRRISAGRTTILITHRLSATRHADAIAVIAGGKVTELGSHDDLLACDSAYAALWRAQGLS